MIIESSLKLKLGARVKILQIILEHNNDKDKIIREDTIYGFVLRPATQQEYITESKDWSRTNQQTPYYYYEIRLEKP